MDEDFEINSFSGNDNQNQIGEDGVYEQIFMDNQILQSNIIGDLVQLDNNRPNSLNLNLSQGNRMSLEEQREDFQPPNQPPEEEKFNNNFMISSNNFQQSGMIQFDYPQIQPQFSHLPFINNIQQNDLFQQQQNNLFQQFQQNNILQRSFEDVNSIQRSSLPVHISEKYYKRIEGQMPKKVKPPTTDEPYMKITVMKTNMATDSQTKHMIVPEGMVDSQKNTCTEEIIIGRQQQTLDQNKNDIHPNDIVLPFNDRAISRIHCKIIYKDGFIKNRPVPSYFSTFLQITSFRTNSIWHKLPSYLLRKVWSFLQSPRKFYIVDIGSVYGTYIKVRTNRSQVAEKGQVYLIGADTNFSIVEVCNGCNKSWEGEKFLFLNMLFQEHRSGVKIHVPPEDQNEFDYLSHMQMFTESTNETQYFNSFSIPYVKIEMQFNAGSQSTSHIFIHNNQKTVGKDFQIGRSQDCDIIITQNTISRKQSRIFYKDGKWQLQDGDINKESANGTWISLTDYREKKSGGTRNESDQKEIEHNSEIKISDSILKIEIFNNEPKNTQNK